MFLYVLVYTVELGSQFCRSWRVSFQNVNLRNARTCSFLPIAHCRGYIYVHTILCNREFHGIPLSVGVCVCARTPKCQLVCVCAHFQRTKGLGPGIGTRIDEIDIEPTTPKSKDKRTNNTQDGMNFRISPICVHVHST